MKVSPSLYRLFEDDDDVAGKLILARAIAIQSDRDRELLTLLDEKLSEDETDEAEKIAKEIFDVELKREASIQIVTHFILGGDFDEVRRVAKETRLYFTATEILELAVKVKDDGSVDTEEFANFVVELPEPPAN